MTFPTLPLGNFTSMYQVLEMLPDLKWRLHGQTAFAIIGGNKETGELHVLAVIEHGSAPEHEHIDGGPYGELIITISGELEDVDDDGVPVMLGPGQMLIHRGATVHTPKASNFWFGYYHQPRGSRLIKKD